MLLSDYLRAQAHWRELKAEEYPEDKRNARSAAALNSLADYVDDGAVDCGNWTMQTLEEQMEVMEAGSRVPSAGERVSGEVSRYGFNYPATFDWQHADMLDELVPLALLDAYELAASCAPDDDRSDEHLIERANAYGLQRWEVAAAFDGVDLDESYFRRRPKWTEQEAQDAIDAMREEQVDPY